MKIGFRTKVDELELEEFSAMAKEIEISQSLKDVELEGSEATLCWQFSPQCKLTAITDFGISMISGTKLRLKVKGLKVSDSSVSGNSAEEPDEIIPSYDQEVEDSKDILIDESWSFDCRIEEFSSPSDFSPKKIVARIDKKQIIAFF